jgi:hypothetical protein
VCRLMSNMCQANGAERGAIEAYQTARGIPETHTYQGLGGFGDTGADCSI